MKNYNDRIEAAYMTSRRQGDLMRDLERERSPHEDRRNRHIDDQYRTQAYMQNAGRRGWESESYFMPQGADYYRTPGNTNRGKGPKNYKRSDERIREIVSDIYCDHPYLDASNIDVEVKDSVVILSGWVDDRFGKRLAEDLAEDVAGVTQVENRIRVNQDKKESYQKAERVNQDIV